MAPPTSTETLLLHKLELSPYQEPGYRHSVSEYEDYKYKHLLPHSDPALKYDTLVPFRHDEPGLRVKDPLNNPLDKLLETAVVEEITPLAGSTVSGIQLSRLTNEQRDELAVFVAQRKVVVFKGQDFADQPDAFFRDWVSYYGRPHIHPTSAHPEGLPEIHLVFKDAKVKSRQATRDSITSIAIHSDVSYELQPPGLTTFWILSIPHLGKSGGDTLFVDAVEAYSTLSHYLCELVADCAEDRLSEPFKKRLEGLEAVHSGVDQADYARAAGKNGLIRREPVEHTHPVVRTHPVTGEKALYVNPQFTRHIVGFKKEESDAILNFLYDHLAKGLDFHVRVKWTPGAVALWDNRITAHTGSRPPAVETHALTNRQAILDFKDEAGQFRHAGRLTPQAERPFYRA